MKKTYETPSLITLSLDKETPVLCQSLTPGTENKQPGNDNSQNIFSTGNGGWDASNWAPA